MSTKQNPTDGVIARREVEIAATPEQVWAAIATGAGNAGWLFPAEIEEREGGAMLIHRAPYGGDAPATVTAYDAPHRFAIEERMDAPGMPPWATEFLIEGREGGTTIVRMVTGFYDGGQGWEAMVEGAGEGWAIGLQMLRVYVPNFLGLTPVGLGVSVDTGRPLADRSEVTAQLFGALGLGGLRVGDKFRVSDDAPPMTGVVEAADEHFLILRSEEPGPGLFEISTFSMDGQTVMLNVVGRLYGEEQRAVAERDEPRWAEWMNDRSPTSADLIILPR